MEIIQVVGLAPWRENSTRKGNEVKVPGGQGQDGDLQLASRHAGLRPRAYAVLLEWADPPGAPGGGGGDEAQAEGRTGELDGERGGDENAPYGPRVS